MAETEPRVPHYVKSRMKLKEETGDDTDYFFEEWKNPEEIKRKQIALFKERKRKALEFTKQFQAQQRKKKPNPPKPKSFDLSNNAEYRKITSPINASSNKDVSKLNLDFRSHSQIVQVSKKNKNKKCNNLRDEVDRLQTKLIDIETKYLNFILRGNPTHKKQVDDELQWLFSQIRDGDNSNANREVEILKEEQLLLRRENEELKEKISMNAEPVGSRVDYNELTLNRIASCYDALCEHHQFNWLKSDEENTGVLNMDDLLLQLEQVVDKISNKKVAETKKKVVKRKLKFVKKKKEMAKDFTKSRRFKRDSSTSDGKGTTKKKRMKKGKKKKKDNKENAVYSDVELRQQQKELSALNQRVSKLDEALRESSAMLSDILVANV